MSFNITEINLYWINYKINVKEAENKKHINMFFNNSNEIIYLKFLLYERIQCKYISDIFFKSFYLDIFDICISMKQYEDYFIMFYV